MNRPLYAQRLNRDVAELFAHNFDCSSSTLTVTQTSDSLQSIGSLVLQIRIFEGPYRGGCFMFALTIPESYPFRPVEIYATQPIWHPNIDLFTGKVALPIEWSPVLTLNSIALAVQMLLLEPSAENPLNLEAFSYYISQSDTFEQLAQKSILGGCNISGVKFQSVLSNPPLGMQWQSTHSQQTFNNNSILHQLTRSTDSGEGAFNPARMSPISSHLYFQRSNNTSTTSMNEQDNSNSTGSSVMDSYSPMNVAAMAMNRTESTGSIMESNSTSVLDDICNTVPQQSTSTVFGSGRKKRTYDETESSPLMMEQSRLAYNQNMPSAPRLERMSSMEISNAYSQLSLGSTNITHNTTHSTTPLPMLGISAPIVSHRIAEGMNTIGNSIQQDMVLQRIQQNPSLVYSLSNNAGNNNSGAMQTSGTSNSECNLAGMEVCSPHKKVRFFADPLPVSNCFGMDDGLNTL